MTKENPEKKPMANKVIKGMKTTFVLLYCYSQYNAHQAFGQPFCLQNNKQKAKITEPK